MRRMTLLVLVLTFGSLCLLTGCNTVKGIGTDIHQIADQTHQAMLGDME